MPKKGLKNSKSRKPPKKATQRRTRGSGNVNVNVKIDQSRRTTHRGGPSRARQPTTPVVPVMTSSAYPPVITPNPKPDELKTEKQINDLINILGEKDKRTNDLVLQLTHQSKQPSTKELYNNLMQYHSQKALNNSNQNTGAGEYEDIETYEDDGSRLAGLRKKPVLNFKNYSAKTQNDLTPLNELDDALFPQPRTDAEVEAIWRREFPDEDPPDVKVPDKFEDNNAKTENKLKPPKAKPKPKSYSTYITQAVESGLVDEKRGFRTRYKNYKAAINKDSLTLQDRKIKKDFETVYFPSVLLNDADREYYLNIPNRKSNK